MRSALIKARKKAGLTQEQVADMIGIHRTHFNSIERGRRTPSLAIGIKIAEVLGVGVQDIFSASDVTNGNIEKTEVPYGDESGARV